jgi:hypothetical protein
MTTVTSHFINVGNWQFIYWPRRTLFFFRPKPGQQNQPMYHDIYWFVVYLWPIEIRKFR